MKIEIRVEKSSDMKEIFEVNKVAFGSESEAKLVELLRSSESFIPQLSLVAVFNEKIIGHILFTKIKIVDDNQKEFESLALAPMAVKPEYQKMGVGSQLIKSGLHEAAKLKFKSVVVLGHENYYPKFGFTPAEKWNIKAPFEVPSNYFMAIELIPDGLKNVSGAVIYPEAFYQVG